MQNITCEITCESSGFFRVTEKKKQHVPFLKMTGEKVAFEQYVNWISRKYCATLHDKGK
ncbi:hypothetical protein STEG23_004208, partial [Scotinomys teguina]